VNKTAFQRLKSKASNLIHQLFHNSSNPHVVGRDHLHLKSGYRRKILSPDNLMPRLMEILSDDEHFLTALGKVDGDYLIRTAVIGEEIRANIYRLERFPSGPLTSPYNDNWRKEDILDIWATLAQRGTCFTRSFKGITSEVRTDLSYDWFEPIVSYVRQLTSEELTELDTYSRPQWTN
jgi:hypothetical protein